MCTVKFTVRLELTVQNTICGSAHSCSPDDGHNDARNMLDKSLIINIRLVASCWSLSLHPTFMMHGHKSLKKCFAYKSQINIPSYSIDQASTSIVTANKLAPEQILKELLCCHLLHFPLL